VPLVGSAALEFLGGPLLLLVVGKWWGVKSFCLWHSMWLGSVAIKSAVAALLQPHLPI